MYKPIFRNRIRELRLQRGLSQTELARLCYCSRNTISSFETGAYSPTAFHSGLICIALGVEWGDCFWYEWK